MTPFVLVKVTTFCSCEGDRILSFSLKVTTCCLCQGDHVFDTTHNDTYKGVKGDHRVKPIVQKATTPAGRRGKFNGETQSKRDFPGYAGRQPMPPKPAEPAPTTIDLKFDNRCVSFWKFAFVVLTLSDNYHRSQIVGLVFCPVFSVVLCSVLPCVQFSVVLCSVLSCVQCCPVFNVAQYLVLSCVQCCPVFSVALCQCCLVFSVALCTMLPCVKCCHVFSFAL